MVFVEIVPVAVVNGVFPAYGIISPVFGSIFCPDVEIPLLLISKFSFNVKLAIILIPLLL